MLLFRDQPPLIRDTSLHWLWALGHSLEVPNLALAAGTWLGRSMSRLAVHEIGAYSYVAGGAESLAPVSGLKDPIVYGALVVMAVAITVVRESIGIVK